MPSEAQKPEHEGGVARTGPAVSERPDLEAIRERCEQSISLRSEVTNDRTYREVIHVLGYATQAHQDRRALLAWAEHLEADAEPSALWLRFRDLQREENEKIVALSEKRRAMLERVQWCIPSTLEDFLCPICQHAEGYHAPDCALAALLTDD